MKQRTTTLPFSGNLPKTPIILFLLFWSLIPPTKGQDKMIFPASDSLPVTADFYPGNADEPYILLFHDEDGSRGEYRNIAPRLVRIGYNCLAVDLRQGKESHFVSDETARRADSLHLYPKKSDCLKDIEGAIRYAVQRSHRPVVLFGSSFSASLCLLAAKNNPDVKAVVAFSPGEFFKPQLSVRDSLQGYDKLTLVAGAKFEYPYLIEISENIPDDKKTIFVPSQAEGEHGINALSESNPASNDYWLSLLMFFRNVKKL